MLRQSYKDIEIILVVNSSTDGSADIVKNFEKEHPQVIHAFYTDEKLGAGGSRQFGLEHSTGEYVCFVDCDDELEPDYVLYMAGIMSAHDIDIVVCNFEKVDENGRTLYVRKYKDSFSALVQSVAPWGKMFRKEYLSRNGMTLRNIPFGEDIIFTVEVYMTNPKVELCNYVGYIWRDNPESTSHTELKGFPQETFEKSSEYFEYIRKKYSGKLRNAEMLDYFIYKYYIWYLLQSGRKVEMNSMRNEYDRVFGYMKKNKLRRKLLLGGGKG